MHIPDGFLSTPVWATLDVVSLPAIGWMAKRAKEGADDRKIPLLGVMGAFVFAAQMVNFPVAPGTSGHLLGGALLAVVLGPAAASVVMAAILTVQAFVFQDGGIVALGANLFNMALVGVGVAYLPYKLWGAKHRSAAIFAGGALSVIMSACLALAQLITSGVPITGRILGGSLALFAVSAAIEGAITVSAANAIERLNPTAVRNPRPGDSRALAVIAVASVFLAVVGVLWASAAPDGIESIAGQLGLSGQVQHWLPDALAGYEAQALSWEWLRKAVAGLAGLVLIYVVCAVTGRLLARRSA